MNLNNIKLYDLSLAIYHGCPAYSKLGTPIITRTSYRAREGYNAEQLIISNHTATHVDTPEHFYEGIGDSASMPLEKFWGMGLFIDLRNKVSAQSPIGPELLVPYDGVINQGDFVLINTGWNSKRGYSEEYLRNFPYLNRAGAAFLRDKQVGAVGIDSLSLGGTGSLEKAQGCHQELLAAGILIFEEVFFPEEVMDDKKRPVSGFPLKIQAGSASPVRLVAYDWKDS
ncbi:MAG: cyclase family protein [Deltaproteobacteria bacterium]|jgi:kynurenine formamidase|nr:cyclase family protein [Deltaproteobacteria bacterium]